MRAFRVGARCRAGRYTRCPWAVRPAQLARLASRESPALVLRPRFPPVAGYPFVTSGIRQPATGTIRCATLVTAPPAGGSWSAGADFAFVGQNLSPLEPGETDRRLEAIIPFVANGAATNDLDLQTNE